MTDRCFVAELPFFDPKVQWNLHCIIFLRGASLASNCRPFSTGCIFSKNPDSKKKKIVEHNLTTRKCCAQEEQKVKKRQRKKLFPDKAIKRKLCAIEIVKKIMHKENISIVYLEFLDDYK